MGNSRALELAGIDRTTPDPVGGKIERVDAGEPTGFMREVAATQLLIRAKSAQSYQADVDNLVQSSHHYLANGIVAIGEMMGRKKPYDSWQLYTDAVTRGFLPRTTIYYVFDELKDGAALSFKATDQLREMCIRDRCSTATNPASGPESARSTAKSTGSSGTRTTGRQPTN